MDWVTLKKNAASWFGKYRFAALILLVGIGLMLIPGASESKQEQKISQTVSAQPTMEQRLEEILTKVKGAGKVSVMLTIAAGEKTVYQTDSDISEDKQKQNTVIITGSDRSESGLVQQTVPAVYQGAIIVCEGADDPTVKLAICDAVAKVTGLGTNQISVVKMK